MPRGQWIARQPKHINAMSTPVEFVFIHHSAMSQCHGDRDNCREMRLIQNLHMDERGWDDIAYNFVVSGDGRIYEGRGWDREGAHTKGWNDIAIAVCFMGNFVETDPDPVAISAVQNLLILGEELGKISPDYKLYGHRDVRPTECPGEKLYTLISSWKNFDMFEPVNPKYH
ncbi:hypothetical protein ScPMuIL_006684 [Solemya velum]